MPPKGQEHDIMSRATGTEERGNSRDKPGGKCPKAEWHPCMPWRDRVALPWCRTDVDHTKRPFEHPFNHPNKDNSYHGTLHRKLSGHLNRKDPHAPLTNRAKRAEEKEQNAKRKKGKEEEYERGKEKGREAERQKRERDLIEKINTI